MMHSRRLYCAGAAALCFVACSADRRSPDTSTTRMWIEPETPEMTPASRMESAPPVADETSPATPPSSAAVETLSDAQIAAVMSAADEAAIQQARVAQRKARNTRARQFAQMMISDHGSAKKKRLKLMEDSAITESGSNLLSELNTSAQAAAQTLQTASASDFDRAYIDSQVNLHQQLLTALDNELIPAAQNADLEALLEEIRPIIDHHLQQARAIQQSLNP